MAQLIYMVCLLRKPAFCLSKQQRDRSAEHPCRLFQLLKFSLHLYSACIISLVSISKISSFQLVSVSKQTGLCLKWSDIIKTCFLVTRFIKEGV